MLDAPVLAEWCRAALGSAPAATLFERGHVSSVVGLALADGRRVVVKVRPPAQRLAACVEVQRRLFLRGFPCPEPLTGVVAVGGLAATAERLIPAAGIRATVARRAALLARLVDEARGLWGTDALAPPPPWVDWDARRRALWPQPDDLDVDLNEGSADWIDELGGVARAALADARASSVVGHADWEMHNLRWRAGTAAAVLDWDSLAALPEPALVGAAAAVFASSPDGSVVAASPRSGAAFLAAYERACGRGWRAEDLRLAWAAGLWVLAYNARKETRGGGTGYVAHLRRHGGELARRAGP